MATETQTQTSSPPGMTVLHRLHSIPLVASSINTVDTTLSQNVFTRSPYSTAKGLSCSAYKLTEPLQCRLAPLIVFADEYANKAVDVFERRYPYPFTAQPEEVVSYVRERRDSASLYVQQRRESVVNAANHTIDERVKSPAYSVAQGLDKQLTPIVDYLEVAVTKLNGAEPHPPSLDGESKYQYQRAIDISKNLKDSLYVMSNEQLKQIQASNALLNRASETAQSITTLASSSIQEARARVHGLSDTMLTDLRSLQSSLTVEFNDVNASLAGIITDFKQTLTSDLPVNEKVNKIGAEVKERVTPVLEKVAVRFREILATLVRRGEEALENAKRSTGANGAASDGTNGANGHAL